MAFSAKDKLDTMMQLSVDSFEDTSLYQQLMRDAKEVKDTYEKMGDMMSASAIQSIIDSTQEIEKEAAEIKSVGRPTLFDYIIHESEDEELSAKLHAIFNKPVWVPDYEAIKTQQKGKKTTDKKRVHIKKPTPAQTSQQSAPELAARRQYWTHFFIFVQFVKLVALLLTGLMIFTILSTPAQEQHSPSVSLSTPLQILQENVLWSFEMVYMNLILLTFTIFMVVFEHF